MSKNDLSGTPLRHATFLRALRHLGAETTMVHIVPDEQIRGGSDLASLSRSQSDFWGVPLKVVLIPRRTRHETRWAQYGAGVLAASAQPSLHPFGGAAVARAVETQLDQGVDLVFAHGLAAMLPLLRVGRRLPALVYDMDAIPHVMRLRDVITPPHYPGKLATPLQMPALLRLERRAVKAAHLSCVCSEPDRLHLTKLRFPGRIEVVPNGVSLPPDPPGVAPERRVLFLGDCTYMPNRFAADRLVRKIWPLLRARVPDAKLTIAGKGSDQLPTAGLDLPGVMHEGFVEDLGALYARSRVVCCPIAAGGGTRLKVVEAAAYARPIVSTRMGAEGLDLREGHEILLREDDAGLAEACASLLQDDEMSLSLGKRARALLAGLYDREAIVDQVAGKFERLLHPFPS